MLAISEVKQLWFKCHVPLQMLSSSCSAILEVNLLGEKVQMQREGG